MEISLSNGRKIKIREKISTRLILQILSSSGLSSLESDLSVLFAKSAVKIIELFTGLKAHEQLEIEYNPLDYGILFSSVLERLIIVMEPFQQAVQENEFFRRKGAAPVHDGGNSETIRRSRADHGKSSGSSSDLEQGTRKEKQGEKNS